MIFPWLKGFLGLREAPVTWTLFAINVMAFFVLSFYFRTVDSQLDRFISDEEFLKTQSFVFAQYVQRNPASYPAEIELISKRAIQGHRGARQALSGLALRDLQFLSTGATKTYFGDLIAIEKWRAKFLEFVKVQRQHPGQKWGISSATTEMFNGLSYQFIHGGALHLITNMFFLLIFGCFLESALGGVSFLLLYLVAGLAAAGTFVQLTGLSMAPLIGASGAINGLVGFFAATYFRRKSKFLFLLLPTQRYSGTVALPSWIFLSIWVLSDLASALGTVPELGGVAYTAHLGGFVFGLLAGGLFVFWGKATSHGVLRNKLGL